MSRKLSPRMQGKFTHDILAALTEMGLGKDGKGLAGRENQRESPASILMRHIGWNVKSVRFFEKRMRGQTLVLTGNGGMP